MKQNVPCVCRLCWLQYVKCQLVNSLISQAWSDTCVAGPRFIHALCFYVYEWNKFLANCCHYHLYNCILFRGMFPLTSPALRAFTTVPTSGGWSLTLIRHQRLLPFPAQFFHGWLFGSDPREQSGLTPTAWPNFGGPVWNTQPYGTHWWVFC